MSLCMLDIQDRANTRLLTIIDIEQLNFFLVFSHPFLNWLAVRHSQIIENQNTFLPASLISAFRNSISLSELNASSMIIQRVLPWLVIVTIIDSYWHVPPTAKVTGVLPISA